MGVDARETEELLVMPKGLEALLRPYEGSIKALLRLYYGSIKALDYSQATGMEVDARESEELVDLPSKEEVIQLMNAAQRKKFMAMPPETQVLRPHTLVA